MRNTQKLILQVHTCVSYPHAHTYIHLRQQRHILNSIKWASSVQGIR